jgi:putative alpha-1,2-mannosidase
MTANGLSPENIYVQSVQVNGKALDNPFLFYREVKDGGTLVFTMGPKPSQWGTNPRIPE